MRERASPGDEQGPRGASAKSRSVPCLVKHRRTDWAKTFFADLEPRSAGAYVNFLDRDDEVRRPGAFGGAAYARLVDLQHRFDPDGVLQPARAVYAEPS